MVSRTRRQRQQFVKSVRFDDDDNDSDEVADVDSDDVNTEDDDEYGGDVEGEDGDEEEEKRLGRYFTCLLSVVYGDLFNYY